MWITGLWTSGSAVLKIMFLYHHTSSSPGPKIALLDIVSGLVTKDKVKTINVLSFIDLE